MLLLTAHHMRRMTGEAPVSTATVLRAPRSTTAHPWTLTAAVWLTVVSALGMVVPLPWIIHDVPTAVTIIGIPFTVLLLAAAWGMWKGWKWAAIGAVVLHVLNLVSSIPPSLGASTETVQVLSIIGVPLSVAACVLIVMRSTRQALH